MERQHVQDDAGSGIAQMVNGKKILVIAHGHPDYSLGGAEIAAHSLFKGYSAHLGIKDACFLARFYDKEARGGISLHASNEYLWEQSLGDDFYMAGLNINSTLTIFADFIRSIRPDIVHLHHGVHLGYEILEVIRRLLPEAKIFFTLHEYIPICHNSGQMIKTDGSLCKKSSVKACHQCFPKKSEGDFWLRKRRFIHYFAHVDGFFAPSEFLRRRYIEWGLPQEKIFMQENCLRELEPCPPRKLRHGEYRNRFGFFGQITKFKGLETLLRALNLLAPETRKKIILEIHGGTFSPPAIEHGKKLRRKYKNLENEGAARWIGAYDAGEVASRMAGVDWVVLPSIWWENSPVVIQEAFACGRPVLASNLGGMAEKIRHGIDGILVPPRNPQSWVDAMLECAQDNGSWERLRNGCQTPAGVREITEQHLRRMNVIE